MRDYYEPKFLAGVIKKAPPLRTFFKNRFFTNHVMFPNEKVSFEFYESRRRLAPYVNPRLGSETIDRDEYSLKTYSTPYIAPNRIITNDTLTQKLLGEAEWNSDITPDERAAKIAAEDIIYLQDLITRREEYMCARVKQDGKLIIKGVGVNEVVDYGFENVAVVDASDRWTENFDICEQLSDIVIEMSKDGINPDMAILGRDAVAMLLRNKKFKEQLDNRRVFMGEIKPAELESGVHYIGRMIVPGASLDILMYNEWYRDEEDKDEQGIPKLKPLVDPETVILQSSSEQNSILYGAVTQIDKRTENFVTRIGEYIPRTWITENPSQKFIEIASRPLPMPHDLKSWYVLKGVITGAA